MQHLVSMALSGGFRADELFDEVAQVPAYRAFRRATEFDWALAFVERGGGASLAPIPSTTASRSTGVFRVPDAASCRRHRLQGGNDRREASMLVA